MSGRNGRLPAPVAALALLSLAALALAARGWLSPVAPEERAAREEGFCRRAAGALERDAEHLRGLAAQLQRSPEFSEIVDGGGTEVRPHRLFGVLSHALPAEAGWGAVFLDATGRAVAWGGEAGDLGPEADPAGAGLRVSFHVTRFSLAFRSPRVQGSEFRGSLVVSRRYPTGILKPDLIELFSLPGGPTQARIRVRAASRPQRLVALSMEPPPGLLADEEVRRARSRPFALLLAGSLLALAAVVRAPVPGIVAVRAALLLAMPRAASGAWEELVRGNGPFDPGLLATPADVLLTGIAAVLLFRLLFLVPRSARPRLPPAAALLLALVPAFAPAALGNASGVLGLDYFDEMNLVPAGVPALLFRTGAVALAVGLLGTAAGVLALGIRPRRSSLLAAAGLAVLVPAFLMAGGASASLLSLVAGLFFASALANRVADFPRLDLLGRTATVVFLLAGGLAIGAAGLQAGEAVRLDGALERARVAGTPARMRRGDAPDTAAWETRLSSPLAAPWLPGREKTLLSDLARALWVRGASREFPESGDILQIRGSAGDVVSSFGLTRPGIELHGIPVAARIPVPGLMASWIHVPYPRESERDPLLSAVVSQVLPDRLAVERVEYDAAGRPAGLPGEDRSELPGSMLAAARRGETASGSVDTPQGPRRMRVETLPPGFVSYAAPVTPPPVTIGTAVAAGEVSLPVLLLLLVAGTAAPPRRELAGPMKGWLFGTFRARLVALVFVFGALPLAGSIVVIRVALERHSTEETARRARALLAEARRSLRIPEGTSPDPSDLNRAAAVIGSDLLLYRDGRLAAASRALPVAAEIAGERLTARVAEALAEGRSEAAAVDNRRRAGVPRVVEAAAALTPRGHEALAVLVAEDEAGRAAVDSLVLFTVAVALGAVGLGGRAALGLGKPVADLIEAAGRLGSGEPAPRLERPSTVDLARLVEAFEAMSDRVRERTESLARERAAAVGLLSNLTAAVILFRDTDGAVLLANPAADDVLAGETLAARTAPAPWAPLRTALDEARRRGSPYETRITVSPGGRQRVFRVVVASLPPDGSEPRSLLLLEDLTDFVKADRLTAWVDAARAIAHDIKNPLTPIRLTAERLLRLVAKGETLPAERLSPMASNILRQVEILTERIGRLARFSDPATLERVRLGRDDVERLLSEVASDFQAHERIRLEVRVPPELPPVDVERPLLRDALTNFVVNAFEAIGDRRGSVVLSTVPSALPGGGPGVRFACEDDGPGVPEVERERLFEPTFSTKSRGSGMGLAAARRAVERHGGTVFASPNPEGGLSIGFTIPAERV